MKEYLCCVFLILSVHIFAQNDLSVTGIQEPNNGCALGANQNVTIQLFNYGATLPLGTGFYVYYYINGGPAVVEMVILGSDFLSNTSMNYTFTTQADLSLPGLYIFDALCNPPADVNPSNNEFTGYNVTNQSPTSGGTLSGDTIACGPVNSGNLVLSGYNGSIVHWEISTNEGASWSILSNTGSSQGYVNLTDTTYYRVLVQNSPCPAQYSLVTPVNFSNMALFAGNDTAVCMGDSVILTASGGSDYLWSDGINDGASFVPTATHTYQVTSLDTVTGCSYSDMVMVEIYPPPTISLGNDFALNAYEAMLNAGGGFTSYLWNDLSSDQTLLVDSSGLYWVTVTDANGCANSDTISVVLTAGISTAPNAELKLYPNPGGNTACLEFINWSTHQVQIVLSDLLGNTIECRQPVGAGSFTEIFYLARLVPGIYVFNVSDGVYTTTFRWIKSN